MLLYARIDTHYLLEIYDKLKNDLFNKSVEMQLDFKQIMRSVFSNSDDVARIRWKEIGFRFGEHYLMVMERHRALQPYEKVQLMDKIFEVRDAIAREAD
jgi:ribonuclease D